MATSTATQRGQQQAGAADSGAHIVGQVPGCPTHVLEAIYGKPALTKEQRYQASLQRCVLSR